MCQTVWLAGGQAGVSPSGRLPKAHNHSCNQLSRGLIYGSGR